MTYQQHPLSAAFPAMSADEYQALKDSIENIGVKNPITLYEGMVLDGWNRYRAARDVGLPCPSQELDAGDDPRDFVMAQNKARRHITQAQIALAATEVYRWSPPGRPNSAGPAEFQQEDVAKKAGVSVRSLRQAAAVREATQVVQAAVRSGEIGLEKALAVSQLPTEQQASAIKTPLNKAAKHRGKPKKVPAVKLVNAEIKAAQATQAKTEAEDRQHMLEEENAALREQLTSAQEDANTLAAVVGAEDKLAAAVAEASKYRRLAQALQARVDSMLAEISELTKSLKYWKTRAEKASA